MSFYNLQNYFDYNDAIMYEGRKGTPDDPYVNIEESIYINQNNKAILTEVPDVSNRVVVAGNSVTWIETDGAPTENQYKVDYVNGVVTFHSSRKGLTLQFQYMGTGRKYTPASRVWTQRDGVSVTETLQDFVNKTEQNSSIVFKPPVASFSDISTTYPTPENGWTTRTIDEGKLYRYDSGSATWKWIDTITTNAYDVLLNKTETLTTNVNTINQNINTVTTQLAESAKDIDQSLSIVKQSRKEKKPIVSFVMDDGSIHDYNKIKPIAEEKGVSFGIGVVSSWVGTSSYMTWEQLHEMEDTGYFEIMSHSHTHPNLTTLSETDLDLEISNSINALREKGFNPKGLVYPHNAHSTLTAKVVGRYYNYAVSKNSGANTGHNRNFPRINNNAIARIALGSYFDIPFEGYIQDTTSLAYYKERVDEALANNAWLVFVLHPASTDVTQLQHLRDTIDYIKSLGIEIAKPTDGFLTQGNIIQTGGLPGSFIVDSEGKNTINSETGVRITSRNEHGLTDAITTYEIGKITITPITGAFATSEGFPESSAGILETTRLNSDPYTNFQKYYVLGRFDTGHIRYANADYTWGEWRKDIQSTMYISPTNAYSVSNLWGTFPARKITITPITGAFATSEGFPSVQGGILTTHRINSDYWVGKQEYKISAILHSSHKETIWERFVDSSLNWTAWKRQGELYFSSTSTEFSINSQSTYDLVIPNLTGMSQSDNVTIIPHPNYSLPSGVIHSVYRTATDTLTIRLANVAAISATIPSTVWLITVKPKLM